MGKTHTPKRWTTPTVYERVRKDVDPTSTIGPKGVSYEGVPGNLVLGHYPSPLV